MVKAKVLKSENDSLTRDKVRDSGGFMMASTDYNIDGLGVDLSVRTNTVVISSDKYWKYSNITK